MNNKHWNNYYMTHNVDPPSAFAQHIQYKIPYGSTVVDLGCGDGRDSVLLAKRSKVFCYDGCRIALDKIPKGLSIETKCIDLMTDPLLDPDFEVDYIYSRFLWHAIPYEIQEKLFVYCLSWAKHKIFIECRSICDTRNPIKIDHLRWPVNPSMFTDILHCRRMSYSLVHSRGLAKYQTEDPLVIRLIVDGKSSST